jgi:hypothetical protein
LTFSSVFAGWNRRTMFVVGSRCLGSGVAGPGEGRVAHSYSAGSPRVPGATDPADG